MDGSRKKQGKRSKTSASSQGPPLVQAPAATGPPTVVQAAAAAVGTTGPQAVATATVPAGGQAAAAHSSVVQAVGAAAPPTVGPPICAQAATSAGPRGTFVHRTGPAPSTANGVRWPPASYGVSIPIDSSPGTCEWFYPQAGGFVNFINSPMFGNGQHPNSVIGNPNGSNIPENFHFVGASMSPTAPSPSATVASDGRDTETGSQENGTIHVDGDVDEPTEASRCEGRLRYSTEEDIRLASSWIHNSIDPIDGNDKKYDQYWADVTAEYNSNTEKHRIRTRNQLKQRWKFLLKVVGDFNGCFARVTSMHQSGMNDQQIMDKAMEMYRSENGGKAFTYQHVWKVVKDERKWAGCVKKLAHENDKSAADKPTGVVNLVQRPMGHKRAKEERNGKRKASDSNGPTNEKLDKFIEVLEKATNKIGQDREKMTEAQDRLVGKRLEAAKLAHKAAQEQTRCKMLHSYTELSLADTSNLNEEALAERKLALQCMRQSLFGSTDNGSDLN